MIQTHEYRWVFGSGVEIYFANGGTPSNVGSRSIVSAEACASICDPTTGDLLFYTDGVTVWNGFDDSIVATNIGGSQNSYHGVVIIPPTPCGAITRYHIFATWEADSSPGTKDMMHSSYTVNGTMVTQSSTPNGLLGVTASERIAVISKADCLGYWIVTQELNSTNAHVVSLDNDTPTLHSVQTLSITPGGSWEEGQIKFSPNGKYLAWADAQSHEVQVMDFNITTATITPRHKIHNITFPSGIEFSPNSQYVYYSGQGVVYQHDISLPPGNFDSSTQTPISTSTDPQDYSSMQLGPDGKIYIVGPNRTTISVIELPDNVVPTVGFKQDALDVNGGVLTFSNNSQFGLPNFARLLQSCEDACGCDKLIESVNETLADRASETTSRLKDCKDRRRKRPKCKALRLPKIKPHIEVLWGQSECDSIESNDVETLLITICNPYDNVTFDNLILSQNSILDSNGDPVALLPNGDPSLEVIPLGAICFGNISPCSCVTREIVVRSRGAIPGNYQLNLKGICFDVNIHQNLSSCFQFDVCGD